MQYTYSPLGSRRGVVVVVTVIMLTAIIGFAALAIDGGLLFLAKTELQRTADAAALAAASKIDFRGEKAEVTAAVIAEATHYASLNTVLGDTLTLDSLTDVQVGSYNPVTGLFQPNLEPLNAVQVTARRTTDSAGGAVPLFLMGLMGHETANVSASSVVMLRVNCYTRGIRAREIKIAANAVLSNMCIYGRERLHFASGATALNTTFVGALNKADVTFGGGGVPENFVVKHGDLQPEAALEVAETINGIEDGSLLGDGILVESVGDSELEAGSDGEVYLYYDDPSLSESTVIESDLTAGDLGDPTLTIVRTNEKRFDLEHAQPNTAYIFNQSVVFKGGDVTLENVTLAVRGNAKFKKGTILRNGAVPDGAGAQALALLVTGDVHFGARAGIVGAVIIVGKDLYFSNRAEVLEGMIEAGGKVRAASRITGLNEGYAMPYGSVDATPVMVP